MKIHHLFWGICLCFSTNILFAQNYQKTSSGIKTTVNAVDIEVQFFAPAVARVIKSPEGVAYEKQSLSVIAKPEKVSFKADIQDNKIVLNTSELSVSVDTGTGIVSYFSKDGKSLLAEKSGMQFINFDDAGTKTYQVYQPFILDQSLSVISGCVAVCCSSFTWISVSSPTVNFSLLEIYPCRDTFQVYSSP